MAYRIVSPSIICRNTINHTLIVQYNKFNVYKYLNSINLIIN